MAGKQNGWGLIGTGRIAEDRVLPGINAHAGNRLIGVVSRDRGRAETFAKKFGAAHAYTSYDELLRNPEVTVVAIHTPNSQHAEQAIAAARAGKHVFCDKPMATTVADAERIVRECDKAGVRLGVNFHNRQMPCFIEARRVIASGEIGEVQMAQVEVSPGARPGGRLGTWRLEPSVAGLGTTYSIGVHAYDILRYLLGSEVELVTALFDKPRGVMEEVNLAILRFANGAMAQLSVHESTPYPHNDFVIYATKGRILGRGLTRSRAGGVMEVTTADGKTRTRKFPAIDAHAAAVAAFSDALLEGRDPVPSGVDGLRSVQVTDAMARSAHEGVHVRLAC
jgi:1,5-anhydro-D-fructose reductase (1,5-anhydro-D-mannitol-forming)